MAHLNEARKCTFYLYVIRPTRYDDDGYPIQWMKGLVPSNSLACLYALGIDARDRGILGPNVDIRVTAIDEATQRVSPERIARRIGASKAKALICLVGVQTNQFPRAMDLAKRFRRHGLSVSVGGFHVSGCLAMLPQKPPELIEALDCGVSLFAGEAEDQRLDKVICDAFDGNMQPIYNYINDMPGLTGAPVPHLPPTIVKRNFTNSSSFDLGRGCPFECSFCCIINVQGRKSRFRTPDDLEKIVRLNAKLGITEFFVTDDNMARNKIWEAHFDRLIALRKEGLAITIIIQVDTLCHKSPKFIEKAVAAGVVHVFVGLENINPDNLKLVQKRQNRITEYRKMLLAWKKHPVVIWGGYIIGFPNDTYESVLNDIEIIKRELPIDILNPSILTPIPGSADHKNQMLAGAWMDPDLNKYDLMHRVIHHPTMSDDKLDELYLEVFKRFYSFDHMVTILHRLHALGSDKRWNTIFPLVMFGDYIESRIYGYESGVFRLKFRRERRPGRPLENPIGFYFKYLWEIPQTYLRKRRMIKRLLSVYEQIKADPNKLEYRDIAITQPVESDFEALELFHGTRGGRSAVDLHKRRAAV